MNKKILHLIRHGEVEEAYQGKFVGRIDVDLSNDGKKQMRKLCSNKIILYFWNLLTI